jgi:hypothetical protein
VTPLSTLWRTHFCVDAMCDRPPGLLAWAFGPRNPTKSLAARGGVCFSLPTGRQAGGFSPLRGWACGPRNPMKNRMLAVGQAVSPANRPEGRLPSSMPRGFSPLSTPAVCGARATARVSRSLNRDVNRRGHSPETLHPDPKALVGQVVRGTLWVRRIGNPANATCAIAQETLPKGSSFACVNASSSAPNRRPPSHD